MNLVPIATIDRAQLQATPANTTSNPFTFIESFSGKRQRNNREEDQSRKRTKRTTPPEGYVCRKCNVVGHWIEDCTVSPPPRENGPRGLPDGYVCKICNVPGHHIRDCTQKPEAKEESEFLISIYPRFTFTFEIPFFTNLIVYNSAMLVLSLSSHSRQTSPRRPRYRSLLIRRQGTFSRKPFTHCPRHPLPFIHVLGQSRKNDNLDGRRLRNQSLPRIGHCQRKNHQSFP